MENIIEIRNRRITINTDMHREDYCKTAILFEVLDGNVTFSYEMHKVTLNKRDLLVINKGTEYQYDASEDIILASLELMGSTFESVCDGVKQSVICNSVNGDNERYDALRAILRQMILNQAYVADNEEEYSYLVFDYYSQYYKLLETIVSFFLSDKAGSRHPDGKSGNAERIAQIERYLNVHYADAVSLDQIADELYLSKGYLSRFFTRSFGMTFSEYIKELRLRRAMSDLLYTDKPITQVAFDNGFTSSSFFNRSFREKYRKNPSEVRREFAGDENGRQAAGKVNTDLSERVNRLLDNDGRPIRELDREQLFTCSAADSTPMKQIWNYLINIGRAADLLELGTQEHLSILEETMPFFSRDFIDPNIGVHGPLFDLGIYHLAQMLYVLGMPELESVYGFQSSRYWTDPAIDKLVNRTAPVEDLGVGMARFKGDICMDIYEDWAIHMEDIGCSFIAGSLGGLKFTDVDQTGGPMAVPEGGQIMGGGDLQLPRLTYYGVNDENQLFETQLDCAIGDVTGQQELLIHPEMEMYNDNQLQWYSYLRGILTDETRIDSPYIAMQTALLSEGVVLSSELGRSVTVDEIKKMAKSIAIRDQETPFGTIHYDFDEYKPE